MPSQTKALMNYMNTILENGLQVGLMGMLYIVITSIFFFNNYEYIVSQIFNKPKKSFFKALSTYWTMLTFTPILLALILFLTAQASDNLATLLSYVHVTLGGFVSFLLTWLMFFILMKGSINFNISIKAVVRSSFFTSLLWFVAQKLFVFYIFANTTYESLYGSFSSILFFFLWIYISWVIYLFGLKSSALIEKASQKD
jgi:membrane protein